jgi:hypothetical protein
MPPPISPPAIPFDTIGPFNFIVTLVKGMQGMQYTTKGVPLALPNIASAYITLAGQRIYWKATELLQKDQRYLITFGYTVSNQPDIAEDRMVALIDQFVNLIYRDPTMGGLVNTVELEFNLADEPQYQGLAGQSVRRYPVVVLTQQQRLAPINYAVV